MDKNKFDDLMAQALSEFENGGLDKALGYINECIQKTLPWKHYHCLI